MLPAKTEIQMVLIKIGILLLSVLYRTAEIVPYKHIIQNTFVTTLLTLIKVPTPILTLPRITTLPA